MHPATELLIQESPANGISTNRTIGWIGAGRMGFAMARRLLQTGADVAVFNRTRAKAKPLQADGASIVDHPAELAGRDIIFTMVSGPADFKHVICGDNGLLSGEDVPQLVVDCSSVSEEGSQEVRDALAERGCEMLSAPVSGNAKVVAAGRLTLVASGPTSSFEAAAPYLNALGEGVTYVGEGELARMVKICHNVLLGVVTQSLSEVNLDWTPTFTPTLLRKDMDLGLAAADRFCVPMSVAQASRDMVQQAIDAGHADCDFSIVLQEKAKASGLELQPENVEVDDGLHES